MAINSLVNYIPSSGADATYRLKNVLSSSSWTVVSSSDGTTAVEGDCWSSATPAANNYAWTLLRSADETRYFTFQRGTNNQYWRVKYLSGSYNADGTATTTPTAVTGSGVLPEAVVQGGGTDASPSFGSQTYYSDGSYRLHIVADTVTQWWWLGAFGIGSISSVYTHLGLDILNGANSNDPDPVVVFRNSDQWFYSEGYYGWSCQATWKNSAGNWEWQVAPQLPYNNPHNSVGTNSITGKVDALPIIFYRYSAHGYPFGYKGTSTTMRWVPQTGGITRGTLLNITGDKSHIVLGGGGTYRYCVPWNGTSDFNI